VGGVDEGGGRGSWGRPVREGGYAESTGLRGP
jgi:hypothetical protein